MKMFNKMVLAAVLVMSLGFISQSQAGIILDDWTFDLTGVGGPVVNDIDALGFNDAPFVATLIVDQGAAGVDSGDTINVMGKGVVGTFNNDNTGIIAVPDLNADFEVTFAFNLDVLVTGGSGAAFTFTHLAGSDVLQIFTDDLTAITGIKATPGTGVGYDQGNLILTFDVLAGDGGSANVAGTLDGSDDATFELSILNTAGVVLDENGDDLVVGTTMAITDANFDLDSNNNNLLDETRGGFGCTAGNQSAAFFCGVEDGTLRLAEQVPEPSTIALLGLSLFGLASVSRRPKKNLF